MELLISIHIKLWGMKKGKGRLGETQSTHIHILILYSL